MRLRFLRGSIVEYIGGVVPVANFSTPERRELPERVGQVLSVVVGVCPPGAS